MSRVYYRLHDTQTGQFMHTAYNTTSKRCLVAEYKNYVLSEGDEEDEKLFASITDKEVLSLIKENGFVIQTSQYKFKAID
jgi:ribosomal protein L9